MFVESSAEGAALVQGRSCMQSTVSKREAMKLEPCGRIRCSVQASVDLVVVHRD